jgi:hypothetical protein
LFWSYSTIAPWIAPVSVGATVAFTVQDAPARKYCPGAHIAVPILNSWFGTPRDKIATLPSVKPAPEYTGIPQLMTADCNPTATVPAAWEGHVPHGTSTVTGNEVEPACELSPR